MRAPCSASARLYPGATICPQLQWHEDKGRHMCGLMMIPGIVGESYRKELFAGAGCCSNLNDWRKDVKQRTPISDGLHNIIGEFFQIFLRALARQWISGDAIHLTFAAMKHELIQRGYREADANMIVKQAIHCFSQQRTNRYDDFIGGFDLNL
jgi:hypothetical protein